MQLAHPYPVCRGAALGLAHAIIVAGTARCSGADVRRFAQHDLAVAVGCRAYRRSATIWVRAKPTSTLCDLEFCLRREIISVTGFCHWRRLLGIADSWAALVVIALQRFTVIAMRAKHPNLQLITVVRLRLSARAIVSAAPGTYVFA